MSRDSVAELQARLAAFAETRDWVQFHSPKNLSMALVAEAGELVEHFQWISQQESLNLGGDKRQAVAHEMADVFIFLLRMAEQLDIDLIAAANDKTSLNESRYPADRVRGSAKRAEEY